MEYGKLQYCDKNCVKAIAPCLTSCIFASFGFWASLGKETQQEWQRFSPLENKWARASFVSPPSAHRLVHGALVDQQIQTQMEIQTQILMGMGAFSSVASGHLHKEELTDKYGAGEN